MISAEMHMHRGEWNAALKESQRLLALESWAVDPDDVLRWLRDADLKQGNYQAARLRYAKAYPALLGSTPPTIDGSNWQRCSRRRARSAGGRGTAPPQAPFSLAPSGSSGRSRVSAWRATESRTCGSTPCAATKRSSPHRAARSRRRSGWRGPYWRYYRDVDPQPRLDPQRTRIQGGVFRHRA